MRRHVAMVFQGAALFDSLTVGENVAYPLREHFPEMPPEEMRAPRGREAGLVNLPGIEEMMPADLSGGMRKRVGLARAIATDPEVILWDEPTTGLDPVTTQSINAMINSMKEKLGCTSIVVTHDMMSAFAVADRIAMLANRRIVQVGTPEEMRALHGARGARLPGRAAGGARATGGGAMSLFTSTPRERRMALRAGLFVAVGLVLAGVVVFFIGQETRLFEEQVTYRAFFPNVQGLTEQVAGVARRPGGGPGGGHRLLARSPAKSGIEVTHQGLAESTRSACAQDSVARLSSLGVLGEKAVDISMGSPEVAARAGRRRAAHGHERGPERPDAGGRRGDERLAAISRSLRAAVEAYADPQLAEDVSASLRSLRTLLEEVEKGDGALHALIYDKEAGRQVRGLLANASRTARRMDAALGHVEALLAEVRTGQRHGARAHLRRGGRPGADRAGRGGRAARRAASRTRRRAPTAPCTSSSTGTRGACSRTWAARRRT